MNNVRPLLHIESADTASIPQLIEIIKRYATDPASRDTPMEIERKWLIPHIPDWVKAHPSLNHYYIYQSYLSVDPEIRVIMNQRLNGDVDYLLSHKTNGQLIREEYEVPIDRQTFDTLMIRIRGITNSPPIYKSYYRVDGAFKMLSTPYTIECSSVDGGTVDGFCYMEIEFDKVNHAEVFDLGLYVPSIHGIEVTDDAEYRMKYYWDRTRLKGHPVPSGKR